MNMRALISLGLGLILVLGVMPAAADDWAEPRDLRMLRDDLISLDYALEALEGRRDAAYYAAFQERADRLRREVNEVADRMRERDRVRMTEVDRMRRDIQILRADIESALDLRWTGSRAVVPSGTELIVSLNDRLDSRTTRVEDRVSATLMEPLRVDGRIVVPVGSEVMGFVRDVKDAGRLSRGGEIELVFDAVRVGAERLDMRTRIVEVGEGLDKSRAGQRAGLGALLGGVLGGILDGKEGAIVGAVLGAGGGVAATKGEDVALPAGTLLTLRLEDGLVVTR